MKFIENIESLLKQKEAKLETQQRIITPESGVPAEQQAQWMIELLQAIYTNHDIAKNPVSVARNIESGQCRCWFVLEKNVPVAVAALIQQADGSVELGRAVTTSPGLGLGSVAMLRAGLQHFQTSIAPLVAEVRAADEFAGIPSGRATQKIMFDHFRLKPHAVAPMFRHGDPIRNEMFILGSTQEMQESANSLLPADPKARRALQPALDLGRALFDSQSETVTRTPPAEKFSLVQEKPFSVVVPDREGSSLVATEEEAFRENTFSLMPVEMSSQNVALIELCLLGGWIPCGVDKRLGPDGHQILLFGKLSPQAVLAPTHVQAESFTAQQTSALGTVVQQFGQKEKHE